jgi:hypothetical protein
VRVSDASALEQVRAHLPPGSRPATSPVVDDLYSLVVGGDAPGSAVRRYHLLYVGVARLARSMELDEVLAALALDMEYTVAIGARRRLFVTAGVVGWHGRALVLLGAPAAVTSRLVAELIRAGATYYSDRYAVLDARGRVHPFPTASRVHGGNGGAIGATAEQRDAARVGCDPLPVGAIVIVKHVKHAAPDARWRPRAITKGQAVLAMLEHALSAAERPAFALRVADAAVADAHATLRGTIDDTSDVATTLLAAAEGRTRARRQRPGAHDQTKEVL